MSNFFTDVLDDATKVETELLGPNYKYYDNIRTPGEMGMSSSGNLSTLDRDIAGLIAYVELLVTGRGEASKTGQPLGTKFFLKTGGHCKDTETKRLVDRYMYIDNVPDGKLPFISSGMGINFDTFEGLIPGILSDLAQLNPMSIFKAFMENAEPECMEIKMETINQSNDTGYESQHVPLSEIQTYSPCIFPDAVNPVTKKSCQEAFEGGRPKCKIRSRLYILLVGALLLYILARFMEKN